MPLGASTSALLAHAWPRLRNGLRDLGDDEHRWEPVPGCPSVRRGVVDHAAGPAPVTTIAWRLWAIGSDTLDRFSRLLFDRPSLPFTAADRRWFDTADASVAALDLAWSGFATAAGELAEDDFERPLGPAFGPMANANRGDALLHVADELVRHDGAIALLRGLWRAGGTVAPATGDPGDPPSGGPATGGPTAR